MRAGVRPLHTCRRVEFTHPLHVPLSGGLGTSAAAYVAGLVAADSLFELDADMLGATQLEGHPDNAAAALHGGFAICAGGRATRFDAPAGLEAVLVVPHRHVRTAKGACGDARAGTAHRRRAQHRAGERSSCWGCCGATGS